MTSDIYTSWHCVHKRWDLKPISLLHLLSQTISADLVDPISEVFFLNKIFPEKRVCIVQKLYLNNRAVALELSYQFNCNWISGLCWQCIQRSGTQVLPLLYHGGYHCEVCVEATISFPASTLWVPFGHYSHLGTTFNIWRVHFCSFLSLVESQGFLSIRLLSYCTYCYLPLWITLNRQEYKFTCLE
jgi:hypothetical protein